ncbi:MAG: MFS transporter [Bacteroidales bacterium]|nr:MFS transporter [Bacteroidales bacterium]
MTNTTTTNKNGRLVAIVTMCFIFAMISFVTNMAAPFGNIWKGQYSWAAMMGNMMNFAAYLFMGIPAGKMLVKVGYKKTTLIALATGFVGIFVQWLSSKVGAEATIGQVGVNIMVYLLGAFICGFCVCMLNTVVNPMLNILGGGGNRGNQFIQIGGTLNSLTGTLTPLLVGVLIGTVTDKTAMSDVAPLLFIAMGVFALAFVIISFVKIPEPAQERKATAYEHSAWSFRHTVLGVIAIFFYVGIEIGIPAQLNFYISDLGFEGSAAVAGFLAASYWFLMMIGRFLSSTISGKISTRTQMISVSSLAILLLLIAIFLPESISMTVKGSAVPMKCIFLALCGICTSIMWGAIFNLAVEGLGKYTEQASGIFMMMVVGGGIMPLIQQAIAQRAGAIPSYWLVVAMLAYLLYYAIWGSRNVNKDIKVD